ncbi:hypothetical protein [Pedobacter sp. BMA]|nr:hypothetical protein [Pedobacter sp. BMA]
MTDIIIIYTSNIRGCRFVSTTGISLIVKDLLGIELQSASALT